LLAAVTGLQNAVVRYWTESGAALGRFIFRFFRCGQRLKDCSNKDEDMREVYRQKGVSGRV
jgi:hypothetical protein